MQTGQFLSPTPSVFLGPNNPAGDSTIAYNWSGMGSTIRSSSMLRIGPGGWARRAPPRWFPIEQEVHYGCLKGRRICAEGIGKTLEMSSWEVRFTCQHTFELGQKLRLMIKWPVLLNSSCRLKLEVLGRVTRSREGVVAVRVERYDFRVGGLQS
jgi:hypothetical protein